MRPVGADDLQPDVRASLRAQQREAVDQRGQVPAIEDRSDEEHQRLARRVATRAPESPHAVGNRRERGRRDAQMSHDLAARELGDREHRARPLRGQSRKPSTAQSLAPAEPFRVCRKRDVVNGDHQRHADPERRRVARREEQSGRSAARLAPARPAPTRCRRRRARSPLRHQAPAAPTNGRPASTGSTDVARRTSPTRAAVAGDTGPRRSRDRSVPSRRLQSASPFARTGGSRSKASRSSHGGGVPGESGGAARDLARSSRTPWRVTQHRLDRGRKPTGIVGRHQQSRISHDFGSAPRLETTTGTPSAIASSAGSPKPSCQEGSTSSRAPAYTSRPCGIGDVADIFDRAGQRRHLQPGEPRAGLGRRRTGQTQLWQAGRGASPAASTRRAVCRCSSAVRASRQTARSRAGSSRAAGRPIQPGRPGRHKTMRSDGTLQLELRPRARCRPS